MENIGLFLLDSHYFKIISTKTMTLKELAKKYHYKEKLETRNKTQLLINFLSDKTEKELWDGAFAKTYRSFDTYLLYFKKQDILIEKGIDPKKHKQYRLTKTK